MTDKRIVLTTASSEAEAGRIARALVENRSAACVNIIPRITSIYRWNDAVAEADEFLLVIKTTAAAFPQIRETIAQAHSYQVPECICLNVEDGSPEYLQWIGNSVEAFKSGT